MNRIKHFEKVTQELKKLFAKKNHDYDDHYFVGDYSDIERWMSIKRKTVRLETFYKNGRLKVPDETVEDTWKDLAVYSIMELMKIENDKKEKVEDN